MITVWQCRTCGYWRYKRYDEIGWLTAPRCDECSDRMTSALRSRPNRSRPHVRSLIAISTHVRAA
jgi:hypothetical protein